MTNAELILVKKAILNEVEGYEFYKMAARDAANDETKQTFLLLAEEERKHVEWLQQFMKRLEKNESAAFDLAALPAPPSPEIFRWEKLQEEDATKALTVFSIGLQMEKASYEFYEKGRDESEDEMLSKLFDILATWERAHYDQFLGEYRKLEMEFWSEQQYAPF